MGIFFKDLIGILQCISGVLLIVALVRIRKILKKYDNLLLNETTMCIHVTAFASYLFFVIGYLITITINALNNGDTRKSGSRGVPSQNIAFIVVTFGSFVTQIVFVWIFYQFSIPKGKEFRVNTAKAELSKMKDGDKDGNGKLRPNSKMLANTNLTKAEIEEVFGNDLEDDASQSDMNAPEHDNKMLRLSDNGSLYDQTYEAHHYADDESFNGGAINESDPYYQIKT